MFYELLAIIFSGSYSVVLNTYRIRGAQFTQGKLPGKQETFCVTEILLMEVIFIFKTSRSTQPIVESHGLRNIVLTSVPQLNRKGQKLSTAKLVLLARVDMAVNSREETEHFGLHMLHGERL
jgi:hypothetical protein